eukprot:CAMPEP_0179042886 /NCGR_PEP_ID=MMETSP0796-20121207/16887_1 /TAXON_ID=73915 /ORGANISM="Pyrodinium bahamense, Strain pbaha01" /LENGTH=394 /DNA_ID=CAMNT_0020739263 /DNA_START=76 /DNA_END=1260 /DNA_ORIENTATION=+
MAGLAMGAMEGLETQKPPQGKRCVAGVSKFLRSAAAAAIATDSPAPTVKRPELPKHAQGKGCVIGICKLRYPAATAAATPSAGASSAALPASAIECPRAGSQDSVIEGAEPQKPCKGCAAGVGKFRRSAAAAAEAAPSWGRGCAAGINNLRRSATAAAAPALAAGVTTMATGGQATVALAASLVTQLASLGEPSPVPYEVDEFGAQFLEDNKERLGVLVLPSGLQYKILRKGLGMEHPAPDSVCICHFEGRVVRQRADGQVFASTYAVGQPSELSPNEVVAGWAEAMQMMVEGDKWELYIHPDLAYGGHGSPPHVAAGDVLVFTAELLEIRGDRIPAVRSSSSSLMPGLSSMRLGERKSLGGPMQAAGAAVPHQPSDKGMEVNKDLVVAKVMGA